jgi:signal transduction histidine kinase/CheY-like chemotaxis protein
MVVSLSDGSISAKNDAAGDILGPAEHLSELAVEGAAQLLDRFRRAAQECKQIELLGADQTCLRCPPVVELDRLVLVRLADVTLETAALKRHQKLKSTLARAERFDAVGRMAGVLAHEFNNLLAVILNHSELLAEDAKLTGESREDILQIREAALEGADFTKRLLMFGRNDLAKPAFVPVLQSVQSVVARFNASQETDVSTHVEIDAAATVWVHPGHWEESLRHLMANAIEAGGTHSPQVRVRSVILEPENASGLAGGQYVKVTVTDDGRGMSTDIASRAVEPFFTTKSRLGSGLGLSLAYSVATSFGGEIAIDTEDGEGTSVTMFLPEHVDAPETTPAETSETATTERADVSTILVVEDEPGVLRAVQRILSAHGYELLVASSGAEALEVIEQYEGTIDLLLTDVVMPGMSGVQLAKRVLRKRSDIRILYMSGYTESALSLDQLVAGKTDLILKPFTATDLLEVIDLHLAD